MEQNEQKILMLSRPTCPMHGPIVSVLKSLEIPFEYIDIRADEEARDRLREINDGYESVPTLIFPDGSTLTEPNPAQLQRKLASSGYEADMKLVQSSYLTSLVKNPLNWLPIILLVALLLAILNEILR